MSLKVLGGEITIMQTIADAPVQYPPDPSGEQIFNSMLVADGMTLAASDFYPSASYADDT